MDNEVVGERSTSTMSITLKDGVYTVVQVVTQERTFDGETWESRQLEAKAVDINRSKAMTTAIYQIAEALDSVGGDLFNYDTLPGEEVVPEDVKE